jgi:hypothetical protein
VAPDDFVTHPLLQLTADVPLATRVRRGATIALAVMGVPCVLLAALALLSGRYVTSRGVELDLWAGAVLYPLGVALAGAIGGAGAPFARTAPRAALVGAVAGVLGMSCVSLMFQPHAPDRWRAWLLVSLSGGALLGHLVGVGIYAQGQADDDERRARRRRPRRDRAA